MPVMIKDHGLEFWSGDGCIWTPSLIRISDPVTLVALCRKWNNPLIGVEEVRVPEGSDEFPKAVQAILDAESPMRRIWGKRWYAIVSHTWQQPFVSCAYGEECDSCTPFVGSTVTFTIQTGGNQRWQAVKKALRAM